MSQRSIAGVPRGVLALFALGLAAQIVLKASAPPPRAAAEDLAPAPSIAALRLASFGDPVPLGKALMLYLQAFDYQSGSKVPYRELDYDRLEAWLARILELDPRGHVIVNDSGVVTARNPDTVRGPDHIAIRAIGWVRASPPSGARRRGASWQRSPRCRPA